MVEIREMLAPANSNCRSGKRLRGILGVTIHETANTRKGAGALNHANYLLNTGKNASVSWHYCVDDKLITRSIPESEVAWHAGDGRQGNGNNETISIEICVNSDSNYELAIKNAIELAADILARHKIDEAWPSLFMHKDWSGKNCPTRIIAENRWTGFNNRVQTHLNANSESSSQFLPDFRVYRSMPGYTTAKNAIYGTNSASNVAAGNYYVFREVEGSINVTKKAGTPGSWINALSNALAKLREIKVGTTVKLAGHVYADSYGQGKGQVYHDTTAKISKVVDLTRPCPFHVSTLGWVMPDSIDVV